MNRPTVATVFGVLSVIFGGLSCISSLIVAIGIAALIALGMIFTAVLSIGGVIAGIQLLRNKKSAICCSMLYVAVSLLVSGAGIAYSLVNGNGVGGFFTIAGLVYPVLMFFFIVRNGKVKAFYA